MERLKQKFPKGTLSFYIQLYCKRKSEVEKQYMVQQEALKSWISLSKSEKKFFEAKYKEYQSNFKKNIAMILKNAEPYLKSKKVMPAKRKSTQNLICKKADEARPSLKKVTGDEYCPVYIANEEFLYHKSLPPVTDIDDIENCIHKITDKEVLINDSEFSKIEVYDKEECDNLITDKIIRNEFIPLKIDDDHFVDYTPDPQNEKSKDLVHSFYDENSNSPYSQRGIISIPEPIAPKIMTGKELFLFIKEKANNDLIWEEFTKPQRRRYANAVLVIKKNYLRQYKEYLEQLPPRQLFSHYRRIVKSIK